MQKQKQRTRHPCFCLLGNMLLTVTSFWEAVDRVIWSHDSALFPPPPWSCPAHFLPEHLGRSLPLPRWHHDDVITSLLWCLHATCSSRGGSWDFFFLRLRPTERPFLYPPGLLLWRCRRSPPSTLRLASFGLFVGQRGQSGVHQWRGRKQFEPTNHHVG